MQQTVASIVCLSVSIIHFLNYWTDFG
jgi:hypothetical protein